MNSIGDVDVGRALRAIPWWIWGFAGGVLLLNLVAVAKTKGRKYR